MVSIARLDIVKIMIENEIKQQIKERIEIIDPNQIKDIIRRIDVLEKSDAKELSELALRKLMHKVDMDDFLYIK